VNRKLAVGPGRGVCGVVRLRDSVAGGARKQVLTEEIRIACQAVTVFPTPLLHTSIFLADGAEPGPTVLSTLNAQEDRAISTM
jgi:hypothetical protein